MRSLASFLNCKLTQTTTPAWYQQWLDLQKPIVARLTQWVDKCRSTKWWQQGPQLVIVTAAVKLFWVVMPMQRLQRWELQTRLKSTYIWIHSPNQLSKALWARKVPPSRSRKAKSWLWVKVINLQTSNVRQSDPTTKPRIKTLPTKYARILLSFT